MFASDDILGSFKPLTSEQLKSNARFIAAWLSPALLVAASVVAAVISGIIWISSCVTLLCLLAWIFIPKRLHLVYTPRFSGQYNFLRFFVGGFLVYKGVAWRSLFGLYTRIPFHPFYHISESTFGWVALTSSLAIAVASNIKLTYTTNVQIADFIGIIEIFAAALTVGSIMFLALYT